MAKLNYRILGKRQIPGDKLNMDYWDIEWTHADGPFRDFVLKPKTHPPDIQYEEVELPSRAVLADQICVEAGMPESYLIKLCEEKRPKLAAALGVQP